MSVSFKGFILLLLLVFINCTPTSKIFLDEAYEKNGSRNSFAVLPFNQDWTPDAVQKKIYGQEIELFYQALDPSFSSNTPNQVNIVKSDIVLDQSDFKKTTLTDAKKSLDINLPSDSLLNSVPERFVYFLEGYGFKLVKKAGEKVSYAYSESTSKIALKFETEFFLYDKATMKVVSWGTVSDESIINGRPKFVDYLSVLSKVSKKMLVESPFQAFL